MATVAAGVLSSAASAESAKYDDTSKFEQSDSSWSAIIDLVRYDMGLALNGGYSKDSIKRYILEAFALMKEWKSQGKRPDTIEDRLGLLWTKTLNSPNSAKSPKKAADDQGATKAELDSLIGAMSAEFEPGETATIETDTSGSGNQQEQQESTIRPDTLPANFSFSKEWAQENVGKVFLQGDRLIVVGLGESPDEQTAADKAQFKAQAGMAKYLAQEGAPQYGRGFISIFGTEEIAHFRETNNEGKHQSVKVMGTSVKKNLGK